MHPEQDMHQMGQQQSRMNRSSSSEPYSPGPDALDLSLTHALATAPAVSIPGSFAARVSAQAAIEARVRSAQQSSPAPLRFGVLTARMAAVLLLIAMFLYAAKTASHSPTSLALEFSFLAEFALLTVWMYLDPQLGRS